ncbi:hypothetical protein [Solibacillus isronensis]|uniref:hypothetical protein n=1 Tax=Solibacillus isronensis TaxID=412383 RepID=UPI0009A8823C|nr:hypothetical protein [Solibacillus isronensis]
MNFSLLKVDNPNKLKSLSRNKINFFKKQEDVSLFHFNKIDNDLYHAVFNISDEYQVSTKKLGNQHNYIYSSLINFFFLPENKYAFMEYINKEYLEEVLTDVNKRTKASLSKIEINNSLFKLIYNDLNGTIKKLKYTNEEDEFFDLDFVTNEKFLGIINSNIIEELTVLVENQFITINKNGRVSVDNSEEQFLVTFTKRILNAIN